MYHVKPTMCIGRSCGILLCVSDGNQQIEELKQLVRRNIDLSTETNKMVHSMHRSQRWGTIYRVIKIGVLIIIAASLYMYLSPFVEQIRDIYAKIAEFVPGL